MKFNTLRGEMPESTVHSLWKRYGLPGQSLKQFAKSRPGCEVCEAWLKNKR